MAFDVDFQQMTRDSRVNDLIIRNQGEITGIALSRDHRQHAILISLHSLCQWLVHNFRTFDARELSGPH